MANVRRLDALARIEDAQVRVQFDIEHARRKLNGDKGLSGTFDLEHPGTAPAGSPPHARGSGR